MNRGMLEITGPDHLRLFVALAIPEPVKDELEKAQRELRGLLPQAPVRWTRREQFHLTLRFLGNVEAQSLTALSQALTSAARAFAPLQLRAEHVGFFPNARFPRVLWVGVRDTEGQLPALQQAVQSATVAFTTEEPEERFSPHVTLARMKKLERSQAAELSRAAAAMNERLFGQWTSASLDLMRSQLSPQQAIHSVLTAVPLAGRR
jgi:2'-5' RNA ligase